MNKLLASVLVVSWFLIFGLVYYIMLPAINVHSIGIWIYGILAIGSILFIFTFLYNEDIFKISLSIVIGSIVILFVLIVFFSLPLTRANEYYNKLTVKETTYEEAMEKIDFKQIPKIDLESSKKIGGQKLSELKDFVSQYSIGEEYTLVNVDGSPYRVSPLQYDDFFKYMANKNKGIPGYIGVDVVKEEASYVELKEAMHYSPSAYFSKDLKRHLRFRFPNEIFGEASFEVSKDGTPYWVVSCVSYKTVFGAKVVEKAILVNAANGESNIYSLNELPKWVDRALDTEIVNNSIGSWGSYKEGFFNRIFAKKDVKVPSDRYNFITKGEDVYLFTGITSITADQSNIGFMLVNMRTGEAEYFNINASTEQAAVQSAEGQVQQYGYVASDPILLNINGTVTYFMTLKDNSQYTKMYAFVPVENAQIVSTTEKTRGIELALKNYLALAKSSNMSDLEEVKEGEIEQKTIVVEDISSVVVDGNTIFFIKSGGVVYLANVKLNQAVLPFVKVGDSLIITSTQEEDGIFEIVEVK